MSIVVDRKKVKGIVIITHTQCKPTVEKKTRFG